MSPKGKHVRGRFLNRRRALSTAGVMGTGIIAGCLGDDDDDDVDGVDDVDDIAEVDDVDDDDDTDDAIVADDTDDDDAVEEIERYDVSPIDWTSPPVPADAQYNYWGGTEPMPSWVIGSRERNFELGWSFYDNTLQGELIESYDYSPGMLEFDFVEDVYWWSGTQYNGHDWVTELELRDWFQGGDDFDSFPEIIAYEPIDDFRVRASLADTWREEWALHQTLVTYPIREPYSSRDFNIRWIEQFEDTGGDMDAVSELREEFGDYNVNTDDEIVHQFHIPFEFRLDGDIGDVGEEIWTLELVPEKNGNKRRYVDEINYTAFRFGAREEDTPPTWEEEESWRTSYDPQEEYDFDYKVIDFQMEFDRWGWVFNAENHPADNPQFRRAWVYMTNRELWETHEYRPQDHVNVFLSDERLFQWVSDDVIDSFTDYGRDEAMWDEAEDEMITGGFEQDGDGNWIDLQAGEPISFDVSGWSWYGFLGEMGSDFWTDINEFGIDTEFLTDNDWSNPVRAAYYGGLIPEFAFESTFGESGLTWAAPNPDLPESVEAPEVGDTDADPDDWVEYDTRAMTDRLGVTVDDTAYQNLVDQLAWVANQTVPKALTVGMTRVEAMNDNRWHVKGPEERPESWIRLPFRHCHHNGCLSYVPEDER